MLRDELVQRVHGRLRGEERELPVPHAVPPCHLRGQRDGLADAAHVQVLQLALRDVLDLRSLRRLQGLRRRLRRRALVRLHARRLRVLERQLRPWHVRGPNGHRLRRRLERSRCQAAQRGVPPLLHGHHLLVRRGRGALRALVRGRPAHAAANGAAALLALGLRDVGLRTVAEVRRARAASSGPSIRSSTSARSASQLALVRMTCSTRSWAPASPASALTCRSIQRCAAAAAMAGSGSGRGGSG